MPPNLKLISSTATSVFSRRAIADWAKPTCRSLELPIAEIVYGLLSGWKSTRMLSPATRMNEVGVSR